MCGVAGGGVEDAAEDVGAFLAAGAGVEGVELVGAGDDLAGVDPGLLLGLLPCGLFVRGREPARLGRNRLRWAGSNGHSGRCRRVPFMIPRSSGVTPPRSG